MSLIRTGFAAAAAAALLMTAIPAGAAPVTKSGHDAKISQAGTSAATDFSSQRRRYVRRYRGGYGPGAVAGAAAVGIIGSAIAAGAANEYYGRPYYGPGYYGPGYGYGPGYNRW